MTESDTTIAVIGLGYVGLPLVREATQSGLVVHGYDKSSSVVGGLLEGRSHIDDISDEDVSMMLKQGFLPSTDAQVIGSADVVVICVPTPLATDGSPDLTAIEGAVNDIALNLKPRALVVLESTTFPGTTDDVVRPILERGGRRCGEDFYLAFSPERVDPGNAQFGIKNTPKVVGGVTEECGDRAQEFYAKFIDTVVRAKGAKEAETTKLLENTYRHINIALVNEMARVSHEMDIDFWDVLRCASTKPFGFQAFYPGPGVGGHCIPIDPNYLSYAVKANLGHPLRFVELAQEINASMPSYIVQRVQNLLNEGGLAVRRARIVLAGVTYKPNISDQRESPATPIAQRLLELGAELYYSDPHVDTWRVGAVDVPRFSGDSCDLLVVLQHHDVEDLTALRERSAKTFDTRGKLAGARLERL